MLPLRDPQVRLVLLSHLATWAAEGAVADLEAAGIRPPQIARLQRLTAMDLIALAEQAAFTINVSFELERLEGVLSFVSRLSRARELEIYFLRNGASVRMMRRLFKSSDVATFRKRRELGYRGPSGRPRSLPSSLRDQILRKWWSIRQRDLRARYYLLHRDFPQLSIAMLERVVLRSEDGA